MDNGNAAQTTTSVGTGLGSDTVTPVVSKAEPEGGGAGNNVLPIPNGMVFNIFTSPNSTPNNTNSGGKDMENTVKTENQTTDQNHQPATSGNGTLPANTTVEEGKTAPSTEKVVKKVSKSSVFTEEQQARLNEILNKEKEDAKKAQEDAVAKVRAEFEQKEQEAREQAEEEEKRKKGEIEELLTKEKEKSQTLKTQLSQTKSELEARLESLKKELEDRDIKIQAFNDMLEEQIDHKINSWPEEIKSLDPKELYPDGYTLQSRIQWVNRAEKAVESYTAKLTVATTPPVTTPSTTVVSKGNVPTPDPVSSGGTENAQDAEWQARYEEYKRRNRFTA